MANSQDSLSGGRQPPETRQAQEASAPRSEGPETTHRRWPILRFLRRRLRGWKLRHQLPFNFAIHLIGIPLAVSGVVLLFFLPWYWGAGAFVLG